MSVFGGRACARLDAVVVVGFLLIALAGCGGGSSNPKGLPAAAGETTTSTVAGGGDVGSTGGRDIASEQTTTTALSAAAEAALAAKAPLSSPKSPTGQTLPKLDLTATLKESCVAPGGTQTITIRAVPESAVGFDSIYSDGKTGMSEGFYGGNAGGHIEDDGTFTESWVVAPSAPAGTVTVNVLGIHVDYDASEVKLTFTVGDITGKCA